MSREFYVYILKNPLKNNEPFYIGKGKDNRFKKHLTEKKSNNIHKFNTIKNIRKNGLEPILEIYLENLTEDDALSVETNLIKFYGRRNNKTGILTNMTDGGEGLSGYKFFTKTILTKDKNGNIFKVNEDDVRWISGELVGIRKGIKDSKQTRLKKSISKKGILPPHQFKKGNIPWIQGKHHTTETLDKLKHCNDNRVYNKIKCLYCDVVSIPVNIKRFHNENCKFRCE